MSRLARRLHLARAGREPIVAPEQRILDTDLRGKSLQEVRHHLRRMDSVVVFTPRWSATSQFLEDLSVDLAVGDPLVACRSVCLRPLKGRSDAESWQFLLHVFGQVGRRGWNGGFHGAVVDRRGFRSAMEDILERIHETSPHRTAVLAHGAEVLSVELIQDLTEVWMEYGIRHPEGRRCSMLLAGSVEAPWLVLGDSPQVELSDFGHAEAASAIVGRSGPMPMRQLEQIAAFTGGVPGLVDAVARSVRKDPEVQIDSEHLIRRMGGMADEVRNTLDIITAHDGLCDRLQQLAPGGPQYERKDVDKPLIMAGLVRQIRGEDGPQVCLRSPAFGKLIQNR